MADFATFFSLIPEFNGLDDDILLFLSQFKAIAENGKFSNLVKLAALRAKCKQNALKFIQDNEHMRAEQNFNVFCDNLIANFAEKNNVSENFDIYPDLKQQDEEKIVDYAKRARSLADNYLTAAGVEKTAGAQEYCDSILFIKFIDGLLPQLQQEVRKLKPKNFNDSVTYAQIIEHTVKSKIIANIITTAQIEENNITEDNEHKLEIAENNDSEDNNNEENKHNLSLSEENLINELQLQEGNQEINQNEIDNNVNSNLELPLSTEKITFKCKICKKKNHSTINCYFNYNHNNNQFRSYQHYNGKMNDFNKFHDYYDYKHFPHYDYAYYNPGYYFRHNAQNFRQFTSHQNNHYATFRPINDNNQNYRGNILRQNRHKINYDKKFKFYERFRQKLIEHRGQFLSWIQNSGKNILKPYYNPKAENTKINEGNKQIKAKNKTKIKNKRNRKLQNREFNFLSACQVMDDNGLPLVDVKIENIRCKALADSGASISIVEQSLLDELIKAGVQITYLSRQATIYTLNNIKIPSAKTIRLDCIIDNKVFSHPFFVTQNFKRNYKLIIGYDFMRKNKVSIDFTNQKLQFGDNVSTSFDSKQNEISHNSNQECEQNENIANNKQDRAIQNSNSGKDVTQKFINKALPHNQNLFAMMRHKMIVQPHKTKVLQLKCNSWIQPFTEIMLSPIENKLHIKIQESTAKVNKKQRIFLKFTNESDTKITLFKNFRIAKISLCTEKPNDSTIFNVGDECYYRVSESSDSRNQQFQGPYVIKEKLSIDYYLLKHFCNESEREFYAHASSLYKFPMMEKSSINKYRANHKSIFCRGGQNDNDNVRRDSQESDYDLQERKQPVNVLENVNQIHFLNANIGANYNNCLGLFNSQNRQN